MQTKITATYIPREYDQNNTHRLLAYVALEALLCFAWRVQVQDLAGDSVQVLATFDSSRDLLSGICDRSTHLLREFFGQFILFCQ